MIIRKIMANAITLNKDGVLRANREPLILKSGRSKIEIFANSSGFRKIVHRPNGTLRVDRFDYNGEHNGYEIHNSKGILKCSFLSNGTQSFDIEPKELDTYFTVDLMQSPLKSYARAKRDGKLYTEKEGKMLIQYMLERKGAPTLETLKNIFAQ